MRPLVPLGRRVAAGITTLVNGAPAASCAEGDSLTFEALAPLSQWGLSLTLEADGVDSTTVTAAGLRSGTAVVAPAFTSSLRARLGSGAGALYSRTLGRAPGVPAAMDPPALTVVSSSRIDGTMAADPASFGSPITSYDMRVSDDNGATWNTFAGIEKQFALANLTAGTAYLVQTRAMNAYGPGPWSASASATTSAPAGVAAQTARIGALTLGGAGGYQIVTGNGAAVTNAADAGGGTATGYTLSTAGVITPTSNGSMAGQDGKTINISSTEGTATITLSVPAGVAHVRTINELEIAAELGSRAMGDVIELRPGDYNTADADVRIKRGTQLSGTWTGANYCVVKSEIPYTARVWHLGMDGVIVKDCYFSFEDLTFVCDLVAQPIALIGRNGASNVRVINNRFEGTPDAARYNRGSLKTGADFNSSLNGRVIIENNEFSDVAGAILVKGRDCSVRGNTGVRVWEDCIKVTAPFARSVVIGNSFTDKLLSYTPYAIAGITMGATTVVSLAGTPSISVQDDLVLVGMTGANELEGRSYNVTAVNGSDITIGVNSTGYTPWSSGGNARHVTDHPDFLQGNFSTAQAGDIDDIVVRGNRFTRGQGVAYMIDGQGIFLSDNSVPMNNCTVEGNIVECSMVNGIDLAGATNSLIQNNTVIRKLGQTTAQGSTRIAVGDGTGCTIRGNVANSIVPGAGTATGNYTIAVDSAAYAAAFDAPPTGEGATVAETAYAPKTGGPLATATPVIGALPHQSFVAPWTFTSPWA